MNTCESRVPRYRLPDPLRRADGRTVDTPDDWWRWRRPELTDLFAGHVYGRTPAELPPVEYEVLDEDTAALGGTAIRRQVRCRFGDRVHLDLLLYLPTGVRPAPVLCGLNFFGNHTVHPDPAIVPPTGWVPDLGGATGHRARVESRGMQSGRWPVEALLRRGYGVATGYAGDLYPDDPHADLTAAVPTLYGGARPRGASDWGALGAWAWGLSRMLDHLADDPALDARRVAVVGHSRLGKAALWASAQDERFAMAVSNNSGCGGAALARRRFGETVAAITGQFPHWFCPAYAGYADREDALPVDQHLLLALVAPRPLYVASAEQDLWADPRGEFLSARHASDVYRLLGADGLPAAEMPPVDVPVAGRIGYHVRSGGHDITAADWDRFCDFADRHLPPASPAD
ncbi:MAG: hypothetical protein WCA46_07745 [Actinocatenispora sp.]